MGMFLSFLGGAAEQFTEDLKELEKNAKAEATLKTKALYENYAEVLKQNRKLEGDLKNDIAFVKAYKPDATEDQISAIVFNRPVMEALKKNFSEGATDTKAFDLTTFTGLANQNASPFTAAQRVEAYLKIPKAQEAVDTTTKEMGMFDKIGASKLKSAQTQTAAALGVSIEQMQGAVGFKPTTPELGAKFDMTMLNKPKTMDKITDEAQRDLLTAQESGNATAITTAETKLKMIKTVKDATSSESEKFNNRLAKLKTDAMSDDPNVRSAANKELAKEWDLEKRRKQATKIEGEGESKVPRLGTLNSVAGIAAANAISAKYGQQVKEGKIAITMGANGEVDIRPMVTDINLRKQITQDAERAASQALSLYVKDGVPINDEVATVLKRFKVATEFAGESPNALPVDQGQPKPARITPPAAAPTQPTQAPANVATLRELANDAISRGADVKAVKARFKQQTGQEL